jgi:rfaE bifunctional protein nucleotidyltransferase chain/domain
VNTKIVSLESMARLANEARSGGRCVVLCHGVFDLIHAGHIRHLQRAAEQGDLLMVSLTADSHVNKGPNRPVFTDLLRAESLAALACVDHVAINDAPTAINVLESIRPDIYVKGSDYRDEKGDVSGNIARERRVIEAQGGELLLTDEISFSSSNLLNEHFGVFPPATREYLQAFGRRNNAGALIEELKGMTRLKVLVFGDAIIDEYCYTEPLGQSGKGNVLAVKAGSSECFAGGAIAVANHLAGFAGSVELLTLLGRQNDYEPFIRDKLKPGVEARFFFRDDAPTLVKRRFVDADMAKLFEVYEYNDQPISTAVEQAMCDWIAAHASRFDAVVVPDFGNGLITPAMIKAMSRHARFLIVNTQLNSDNRGYHVISRWPRVDFVCLNEPELRMAAHDRHSPIAHVARQVMEQVGAGLMAVTRGTRGAVLFERRGGEHGVPALSASVIDRVGAGDAFMSLAGLAAVAGCSSDQIVFIGSVAAALDVQIVCNREAVEPVALFKYLSTLLK